MRRGFSIFLILLFGLGPLSVMVDGSEDAGLPACCRRHGAHRCSGAMQMASAMAQSADPRPSFTAPATCPEYPGPTLALLMPAHALTVSAARLREAGVQRHKAVAGYMVGSATPSRTHAGRGPPAANLS
jgi:hypothetical protein